VKVIAPVARIDRSRCLRPLTTSGSPGLAVPTICTVVGSTASPVVSLPSTSTVTGVPVVLPADVSSVATGT
jgi:hypothetical protein